MTNEIIPTFIGFNFEKTSVPLIVVYDNPTDFKGHFVARLFYLDKPTPICIVKDTLTDIQNEIPDTFAKLARNPLDDPKIVCVFV